jgi:hypothetical protein
MGLTGKRLPYILVAIVLIASILIAVFGFQLLPGNNTTPPLNPTPFIASSYTLSSNDYSPIYGQTQVTLTISPTPQVTWYIYVGGDLMFTENAGVNSQNIGPIFVTSSIQWFAYVGGVRTNTVTVNIQGGPTPKTSTTPSS